MLITLELGRRRREILIYRLLAAGYWQLGLGTLPLGTLGTQAATGNPDIQAIGSRLLAAGLRYPTLSYPRYPGGDGKS